MKRITDFCDARNPDSGALEEPWIQTGRMNNSMAKKTAEKALNIDNILFNCAA